MVRQVQTNMRVTHPLQWTLSLQLGNIILILISAIQLLHGCGRIHFLVEGLLVIVGLRVPVRWRLLVSVV